MLGTNTENLNITVKYDGSPSIVVGNDPKDGHFFVATKGIFNKTPVVYKSISDLDAIENEGLRQVMTTVFSALQHQRFFKIVQGDLMWTPDHLNFVNRTLRFKTNTLSYEVSDPEIQEMILNSRIGVAWHTSYDGDSLETLTVSNRLTLSYTKTNNRNLVSIIPTASVKPHFLPSAEQHTKYEQRADFIDLALFPLPVDFNEKAVPLLKKFFASYQNIKPLEFPSSLIGYVTTHYDRKASALKTKRGKDRVYDELYTVLLWVNRQMRDLYMLYGAYKEIVSLKHDLIQHYDASCAFQAYLPDGTPTGQEGYVIKYGEIITKLVNRNVFTEANRLNNL